MFARDGVAHLIKISDESLAGEFAECTKNQKIPASAVIKQAIKSRATKKFKASNITTTLKPSS